MTATGDSNATEITASKLTPRPCGHRHRHFRTILACVTRHPERAAFDAVRVF